MLCLRYSGTAQTSGEGDATVQERRPAAGGDSALAGEAQWRAKPALDEHLVPGGDVPYHRTSATQPKIARERDEWHRRARGAGVEAEAVTCCSNSSKAMDSQTETCQSSGRLMCSDCVQELRSESSRESLTGHCRETRSRRTTPFGELLRAKKFRKESIAACPISWRLRSPP